MINKTKIYLRADGNNQIGLGHVHRLLALSEMLNTFFECIFLIRSPLPGLHALIKNTCHDIIDIQSKENDTLSQLLNGNEIVVLDGYAFETSYQQIIKDRGSKLVCIDDIHNYHFISDVIINPAGGIDASVYSKEATTKVFSGPEFAVLKKTFLELARTNVSRSTDGDHLLICMGGADPDNNTLSILQECLHFPFRSYSIVVGEAFRHNDMLSKFIIESGRQREINVFKDLDSISLASLMKKTGVAVCSASGIAYEYLCARGELYLKQTIQNQELVFNFLTSFSLAFSFDRFRVRATEAIVATERQQKIFDGGSDKRLLKIFNQLDFELNCKIRRATLSDLMTLFDWANDPELRLHSYNTNPITLPEHVSWFNRKLEDTNTFIFIFDYKNTPIAQVRFDLTSHALISYSIGKGYRGRGWGQLMLQLAIKHFYQQQNFPGQLVGYVKKSNIGSMKIFTNLGFDQHDTIDFPNSYRYEYKAHEKGNK